MLGLQGVDDSCTRPMTAQVDCPRATRKTAANLFLRLADRRIWSRASGTATARSRPSPPRATTCSRQIHGTLAIDNDRAVIDRLWNPIIASWYKDGKDDPDLALVRFDADKRRHLGSEHRRDAQGRGAEDAVQRRPGQGAPGRASRRGRLSF